MQSDNQMVGISKKRRWTGRILSILVVLFLLFDCVGKFMKPPQVVEACVHLGVAIKLAPVIGAILLVCTILYAIPRTAAFGGLLLTGYLGGAVAIQMRAGTPLFAMIFPVIFAVLVWAGLFLRDTRLRILIPGLCHTD